MNGYILDLVTCFDNRGFTKHYNANLDINHDLYASAIRKNQDHPYLYGIGGLSV